MFLCFLASRCCCVFLISWSYSLQPILAGPICLTSNSAALCFHSHITFPASDWLSSLILYFQRLKGSHWTHLHHSRSYLQVSGFTPYCLCYAQVLTENKNLNIFVVGHFSACHTSNNPNLNQKPLKFLLNLSSTTLQETGVYYSSLLSTLASWTASS